MLDKINKRVVLAGGPSTGKTSIINKLKSKNFCCFDEAAREILDKFKLKGLEFKNNPHEISKEIFIKRDIDYNKANLLKCKKNIVFYDRGIHEITAYLNSINMSSDYWNNLPKKYIYDLIFIFNPWEEIYTKDENRIENFSDAKKISPFIHRVYEESGINLIEVPNIGINERINFILKNT